MLRTCAFLKKTMCVWMCTVPCRAPSRTNQLHWQARLTWDAALVATHKQAPGRQIHCAKQCPASNLRTRRRAPTSCTCRHCRPGPRSLSPGSCSPAGMGCTSAPHAVDTVRQPARAYAKQLATRRGQCACQQEICNSVDSSMTEGSWVLGKGMREPFSISADSKSTHGS